MVMMDGVALSIDVRGGVEIDNIPEALVRLDWYLDSQAETKAAEKGSRIPRRLDVKRSGR